MVKWGMTPAQAIRSATSTGGGACWAGPTRWERSNPANSLTSWRSQGDPIKDITALENVDFVMKKGAGREEALTLYVCRRLDFAWLLGIGLAHGDIGIFGPVRRRLLTGGGMGSPGSQAPRSIKHSFPPLKKWPARSTRRPCTYIFDHLETAASTATHAPARIHVPEMVSPFTLPASVSVLPPGDPDRTLIPNCPETLPLKSPLSETCRSPSLRKQSMVSRSRNENCSQSACHWFRWQPAP